jgi:putative FmdB family regulatory protein
MKVQTVLKGDIMPLYEFKCPSGTITEKFVKMDTKEITCPRCHKKAKKIISACFFELKGGGWCADGYSHEKEEKGAKNRG